MLYRRDGDILTSLSWTLGAAVVKPDTEVSDLFVPMHANNTSMRVHFVLMTFFMTKLNVFQKCLIFMLTL